MSSAWPRPASAPSTKASTPSPSAIFFLKMSAPIARSNLAPTGLEPLFPLWKIPTDQLAREMIAGGLRARISCVDTEQLPAEFAGREFDEESVARFSARQSIPAPSAASFTPASTPAPCSRPRSPSRPERSSPATASSSPTF